MTLDTYSARRLLALSLGLGLLLAVMTSCASSGHDAVLKIQVPAAESSDESLANTGLGNAPVLDRRDDEDNQLAIIEALRAEREELRTRLAKLSDQAGESQARRAEVNSLEADMSDQIDRMKRLLEDSRGRENELQRQLLLARLEAVRHEQDSVRTELTNISSGDRR